MILARSFSALEDGASNASSARLVSAHLFFLRLRICQGRYFADVTAWLTIANVLAVFDILPPIDPATGLEVAPPADFLSGFTR